MPLRLPRPSSPPGSELRLKLRAALERRRPLFDAASSTNCFRIINEAGDGVPRLVVDWLDSTLVAGLEQDRPPPAGWLSMLLDEAVRAGLAVGPVYVKIHPRFASGIRQSELEALAPTTPIFGEPRPEIMVTENGARFLVRTEVGLSTGLFLDMRDVRDWVLHNSHQKQVLNLFAYTCGFGVAALRGGAARVVNVDASRRYLQWGQQNYALNQLDTPPTDFLSGDAAEWLRRLHKRGDRFDLVVLDPPSFGRANRARFSAEQDLATLVTDASAVVPRGGVLIVASNMHRVSEANFHATLRASLNQAGRRFRPLATWHEPRVDFPRAESEAPRLKVSALRLS